MLHSAAAAAVLLVIPHLPANTPTALPMLIVIASTIGEEEKNSRPKKPAMLDVRNPKNNWPSQQGVDMDSGSVFDSNISISSHCDIGMINELGTNDDLLGV